MTPKRRARRLRRFLSYAADPQLAACHPHLLQLLEYLLRHALRQVHVAVVFANIHPPDEHAFDFRFVGDGADDVSGLDTMYRPYFDTKSFHLRRTRPERALFAARIQRRRRLARGGAFLRRGPLAVRWMRIRGPLRLWREQQGCG